MADAQGSPAVKHYGATSFVAAVVTVAVFEIAAWSFGPYFLFGLYYFGVASLIVLPMAILLTQARQKIAQIGRGILIGYLATPLTAIIVGLPIVAIVELRNLM